VHGKRRYQLIDFHNARTAPQATDREVARAIVRFFQSPGGSRLLANGWLEEFVDRLLDSAERTMARAKTLALCRERLA